MRLPGLLCHRDFLLAYYTECQHVEYAELKTLSPPYFGFFACSLFSAQIHFTFRTESLISARNASVPDLPCKIVIISACYASLLSGKTAADPDTMKSIMERDSPMNSQLDAQKVAQQAPLYSAGRPDPEEETQSMAIGWRGSHQSGYRGLRDRGVWHSVYLQHCQCAN